MGILLLIKNKSPERCPASTVVGVERLKIDRSLGHLFSLQSRDKRDALKKKRFFEIENVAHRGEDVDMTDIVLNSAFLKAWRGDDEGNPDRRVIGKKAVRFFTMLSQ